MCGWPTEGYQEAYASNKKFRWDAADQFSANNGINTKKCTSNNLALILQQIVAKKRAEIERAKTAVPEAELRARMLISRLMEVYCMC